MAESSSKQKSTNPFDSPASKADFPDTLNSQESDDSNTSFYDCQEQENGSDHDLRQTARRSANINFDKPFDDVEMPALDFQKDVSSSFEFFSPLESAMMQLGNSTTGGTNSSFDSEVETLEDSPLLGHGINRARHYSDFAHVPQNKLKNIIPAEIDTNRETYMRHEPLRKKTKAKKLASVHAHPDVVLKELAGGENEFSMDYKYILLEELGTASSWLILLLPYFAFCVCLIMESSAVMKASPTRPMLAALPCGASTTWGALVPAPILPCHYSYRREFKRNYRQSDANAIKSLWYEGVVFESGIVERIPVLSTYLYGDAFFTGLSTEAVALVAQGKLEATVEVLQQDSTLGEEHQWTIMSSSNKKIVSMVCDKLSDGTWNCKTPRIVDIVFSMPDTAVYAGGDIRVNIYYLIKRKEVQDNEADLSSKPVDISHVYAKGNSAVALVELKDDKGSQLVEEIVASSEYSLEHMSPFAMKVDTGVRLATFVVSVGFIFYWMYNMGIKSLFSGCRGNFSYCFPPSKTATEWWESHWILFPERYYILVLLFALLLIQEPLLSAMVFSPILGASPKLHIAADATIGIGVHGILFVYLCLFHGFRFHTAAVSKKRADHQRQILQLRRAAKYVKSADGLLSPSEKAMVQYADNFYDIYGDIDGSVSNNHRLQNDPCGDGWADFLLVKLLLVFVGVASVITTARCRFPAVTTGSLTLDEQSLDWYRKLFVVSSIVNFLILLIWLFSIVKAAIVTGKHLRGEKFLSTRPVQLAMRIIFAHVTLGFAVLAVAFCLNMHKLLTKWSLDDTGIRTQAEDVSQLETAVRVLSQVALTFPYSGTAASVGGGRVFFATVSILITAFIFLPAHVLEEDEDDPTDHQGAFRKVALQEKLQEQRRLKRDKRLVVRLAKEAKTWRIFPLPIDQSSPTKMLEDNVFQLYKDLHRDGNIRERGLVSRGPYTPVFCLELACWLNEASWQAYYSPPGISLKTAGVSPGGMNLESLGLTLEGAVYDDITDTQVFVATNFAPQVDGEEDSTIVISFRGTASASNLQTDLRSKQVPLLDQLTGVGSAPFRILRDKVEIDDDDGWIWDTPKVHSKGVQCVTSWSHSSPLCMPSHCARKDEPTTIDVVSKGARAILQATPVARGSFPLVHEGFQDVYIHIRKKLLDIIFPVLQRQLAKSLEGKDLKEESEPLALPKIYTTGHSLGGSLAQLLALDLASNCEIVLPTKISNPDMFQVAAPEAEVFHLPESYQRAETNHTKMLRLQPPIAVYTFGQPRVGNKQFSRFYKQRVPHSFRVVNEGDAITSMPNRYFCGGVYKHAGLEVLLDEGMTGNILVGPTVVETIFRFSPVRTNMLAHTMTRYRDCLECAFEEDELLEYYRGHNVVKDVNKGGSRRQSNVISAEIPSWMTQVGSKKGPIPPV